MLSELCLFFLYWKLLTPRQIPCVCKQIKLFRILINMLLNTKYFSDFQSLPFIFNGQSILTNKAKINKAYNKSVSKLNTKPVLIEIKHVFFFIIFGDNIAQQQIYKLFFEGRLFFTRNTMTVLLCMSLQDISISKQIS